MPTQDLDTLDGSQAWWQELGNRIADAYKARSQDDEAQKEAAQQALEDFRDYPKLPQYEGLRQTAVDAIADFLLDDIDDALSSLSALEDEIRSAAQHEVRVARFATASFRTRQYLLRALTSLTALQAHQSDSQAGAAERPPSASRQKLDQAVKLIGELLAQGGAS